MTNVQLFYLVLSLIFIGASIHDIKEKKISNYFSILNIFAFAILIYFKFFGAIFSWKILILPITSLILGMIVFKFQIMGAGDSKFLSTFLLNLSFDHQVNYIGVLAVTILIYVPIVFTIFKIKSIKRAKDKKIIFAPCMFLAWAWFLSSRWTTI